MTLSIEFASNKLFFKGTGVSAFTTIKIVIKFSTRIPSGGKKASRDNELKQMISHVLKGILLKRVKMC